MSNYNPKSLNAEEFISHEEILETIEYAEKNKHNNCLFFLLFCDTSQQIF